MPLFPGTHLGPYEITGPLGSGGMGEVYRARDTRLERTVAIKILPRELSNDPIRKQRFEREAKTISSLNHPHICVLYDVGSQDGIDYLVMECVEGETLSKRLEKGSLPLDQVLKVGREIADALDKAHCSAVVHRDLKPGNIMLTPTGAKLLDFGLAKPAVPLTTGATLTAAATPSTPVTQEGTILGTFQYMSPEQIEGKELDGRSDIFSLGAENCAFLRHGRARRRGCCEGGAGRQRHGRLGQAEVEKFRARRSQHDVAGLQIAVDHAVAVRFVQRIGNLAAEFKNLLERDRTLLQALRQRLAFETFHDEVVCSVLMANVVQHADVRVIQAGNGFGFALETLLANGIIRELRRQDLDGDRAVEPRVPRAENFAHSARAQRRHDFIRTKFKPGSETHD